MAQQWTQYALRLRPSFQRPPNPGLEALKISDPFHITGPAVISFSGGRTSGYMLWRVIQAHGGTLPDDVIVLFANTGREMPATLDFVRDCGAGWGVPIIWAEYDRTPQGPTYRVVNHNSASRDGEPLELLFKAKSALPNPVQRFCTIEAKILTMKRYVMAELGWAQWTNVVGLRADEKHRLKPQTKKDRWVVKWPLAEVGVTQADVMMFWQGQPFDLRLKGKWEGNCDGCFLKSEAAVTRMTLDYPARMAWWPRQEAVPRGKKRRATFRADRADYATIARVARDQGALPYDETMVEGGAECGMACTD